jgi:hypothetical protein
MRALSSGRAFLADSMSMLSFFTLVSNELVSFVSDLTWKANDGQNTRERNESVRQTEQRAGTLR